MNMNFTGKGFSFGFNKNAQEICTIEIFVGKQSVEQIQMPLIMAKNEMAHIVKEISHAKNPMKVVCSVDFYTEKEDRHLINSLTFQNKKYMDGFE